MKSFVLAFILLSIATIIVSCSSDGNEPYFPSPELNDNQLDSIGHINILCIGNSYSVDALAYLPYVMGEIAPNMSIKIGVFMHASSSLSTIADLVTSNSTFQSFHTWDTEIGKWLEESNSKPAKVIAREKWDVVIIHQLSTLSVNYDSYSPHLQTILDWLKGNGYQGKKAWMLTPAYADGFKRLSNGVLVVNGKHVTMTSDEMFLMVAQCAQQVMTDYNFDMILPCGTAIQNGRHTMLREFGDFKNMTYEGLHLQDGIGRYLEAYTVALALLNVDIERIGINAGNFTFNENWYIPYPHGTMVGMDFDSQLLARKCARAAIKAPYVITTVE